MNRYFDDKDKNNNDKTKDFKFDDLETVNLDDVMRNEKYLRKKSQKDDKMYEEEYKKVEDHLFVINGAKIRFGSHIGTFRVLNYTPSIQGKAVGTEIELTPANFTFKDGFQILSLTSNWQNVGTAKFQYNLALIKKSTIMATGKMPPVDAPIESGKIEFITSGQVKTLDKLNFVGLGVIEFEPKPKLIDFYLTDKYDNRLKKVDYGAYVYLHIETIGYIGKEISIDMSTKDIDYLLDGVRLKDGVLKDYVVKSNHEKVELKVVEPIK